RSRSAMTLIRTSPTPPSPTPIPYTTLFRSRPTLGDDAPCIHTEPAATPVRRDARPRAERPRPFRGSAADERRLRGGHDHHRRSVRGGPPRHLRYQLSARGGRLGVPQLRIVPDA